MSETDFSEPASTAPHQQRRSSRLAFAEQELRLISSLVLLIGLGLFLALPFVLSIGSVVFLPVVTALVLTVILSPLADKLNGWGLPNALASLAALLFFFAILLLALALILQPAVALFDDVPAMAQGVMARFGELRERFAWIATLNEQLAALMNSDGTREVVLAAPSLLEQVAFATPSLILETILTLLMAYFMIEARVRLRQRLLFGRASFGTSIKAARVIREVQDRVAAYILTVGSINAMVGVVVALGAWALGVDAPIMWGGLAALPRGQYEAADSLGLDYWKSMRLIILPQALKISIPGIVNTFIGLFKDTSLVYIIGLADLLGTVRRGFNDPDWITPTTPATGLVFAAFIYWLFCFSMSRYSIYTERRLDTGHKS